MWRRMTMMGVAVLVAAAALRAVGQGGPAPLGESLASADYREVPLGDDKSFETPDGFEVVPAKPTEGADSKRVSVGFGAGDLVLLDDGRLAMVYVAEGSVLMRTSTDHGETWSAATLVDRPDEGVRPGRPALIQARDGTLWVFYFGWVKYDATDPSASQSDIWVVHSRDGGTTWSGRTRAWAGYTGMLQGGIETSGGHMLLPFCRLAEPRRFVAVCLYSTDGGASWHASEDIDFGPQVDAEVRDPLNGGTLEPTVVELSDGRILMLIRTIVGRLWSSESRDGGVTWSAPRETGISCGGTVVVERLASGRLALLWNPADWESPMAKRYGFPHGFTRMAIALSDDDGATWHRPIAFARAKRVVHSLVSDSGRPGELLITMPSRPVLLRVREERLLSLGWRWHDQLPAPGATP